MEEERETKAPRDQERFRNLTGPYRLYERTLCFAIPVTGMFFVLDIPLYFRYSLFTQQYLGIFLGLILALLFVSLPITENAPKDYVPFYDLILSFASLGTGMYILIYYPDLIGMIGIISPVVVTLGAITIFLVLEGTRRSVGWPLVVLVVLFMLYMRYGYLFPGELSIRGTSWERLATDLFIGADSLYGIALRVAASIVFAFILFAQFLFGAGGADFFFNFAEAIMGRFRGGPAKISIVASSLFGSLSGSAVANTVSTGSITIPLMKRSGYSAHYASAIEAVASTGGVIAPPVMGAAAFIIAEFLAVPYVHVVTASFIPAVLYYLCLFIQVDIRAVKSGLTGLSREEIPSLKEIFLQGWIWIVPIVVMIYYLFVRYQRPETSVLYALLSLIIVVLFRKKSRQKLLSFMDFFEKTSKGMFEVTIVCAAAGFIIGVITYTGLAGTLSRFLAAIAGGNVVILTFMTALASVILGMGMPVTASYIVLALLIAPALVGLGIEPLPAHLFIFFFGAFSFITPPVCLCVYAAAPIGEASIYKTAVQSLKLALAGFVVPFLLIFNPAITLAGSTAVILYEVFSSIAAVLAICFALEGYVKGDLSIAQRLMYGTISILLFMPLAWYVSLISLMTMGVLLLFNFGFLSPVTSGQRS